MHVRLFLRILNNTNNDIRALLDTQNTGVKADIVILSLAPGAAGVVLIIHPAALILFSQTGLRGLLRFAVKTDDALSPVGGIRKDINMEGILPILEDIVCIPAYDDARTLVGQL